MVWSLSSGQLVGSMKGRWFTLFGRGTGNARILVRRQGAEKTGWAKVQVQVRTLAMAQGSLYTPREAGELAALLEEAARKVDPR